MRKREAAPMMVVRINLQTREQTVLKQEPHPRDVTPDQFAYLLAKYAMARKKLAAATVAKESTAY